MITIAKMIPQKKKKKIVLATSLLRSQEHPENPKYLVNTTRRHLSWWSLFLKIMQFLKLLYLHLNFGLLFIRHSLLIHLIFYVNNKFRFLDKQSHIFVQHIFCGVSTNQ